ncbi:P-II family nitrogen regulator [Phormidesmis priestleyi]
MQSVKRIEIMASSVELNKLLAGLEKAGVPGYTVIHNVTGKSDRGTISEDFALNSLDNVYIIAFCNPDKIDGVIEKLNPILNKFGGACFVSDAMQVAIVRCVSS